MIKTFTHDDLIRFIYKETDEKESKDIRRALLLDPDLMESYSKLLSTHKCLHEICKEPSKRSIDNILQYSKRMNCSTISN